ncbi:MAG: right-handed parallel beta-helix repeat-containing protein [Akkermansiaceae bacterium]
MKFVRHLLVLASPVLASEVQELQVGPGGLPDLAAAKEKVRTMKKGRPIVVSIAPGTYAFEKAVVFDSKDSGSAEAPVTYRAKGRVVFDGTREIPIASRKVVADPETLARLCEKARGKVVSLSVSDSLLIKVLSSRSQTGALLMQDGELMRPSRFPNVGFAHAKELLVADEATRFQKKPVLGTRENPKGAIFTLRETPAGTWEQWQQEITEQKRALCVGYLSAQWYREAAALHKVSPEGKIQFVAQTRYGLEEMVHKFQSRQSFLHLICEVDEPGEWYFDAKRKTLFLWPLAPLTDQSRLAMASANGFLHIAGASHLRFEGFTVQGAAGGEVVRISNGDDNSILGFKIRNHTASAFSIAGTNNLVHGCDVSDVSRFASLYGGKASPTEITPAGNVVANCHFYRDHFQAASPTVHINGVGNTVRNCLFHNLPGQALVFKGNDHLIEQNEFFNIGFEEGDGATIYTGAQFWGYGTKIKHNFLHHILSTDGLMTRSGIMLDDHHSGVEVIENIFYKTGFGSLAVNGGTGHEIHGNMFMKGNYGVWVRIIGNIKKRVADLARFDSGELKRGDKHDYIWRCEQVVGKEGWNKAPWIKYPTFAKVMNQPNEMRFLPIENSVSNTWGYQMENGTTYRHPGVPADRLVFHDTKELVPKQMFQNPDSLDFRYRHGASRDLPHIPFSRIGLYLDEYRKSMPDPAKYRPMVRQHFEGRASCNRKAKYNFDHVNETIYWNSGKVLQGMVLHRR